MPGFAYADVMGSLTLQLRWVHEWCFPVRWAALSGTRPFTTVWYMLSGKVLVWIDREEMELTPEHVLIVPAGRQLLGCSDALPTPLHYARRIASKTAQRINRASAGAV